MSPCDSRYDFNFIVMLKLLKEVLALQKAVGDPAYIEDKFDQDAIKARANETVWWNGVTDVCEYVFRYLRVLRSVGSNAQMLSKTHGRKKQLGAQFDSWLSGAMKLPAAAR